MLHQSYSHSNHLHVASLQVPMQLSLIGFNDGDILSFDAELTPTGMLPQRSCLDGSFLVRILESQALSACAHLDV